MRYLILILATLATLALWVALVVWGALQGWWQNPVAEPGDADGFLGYVDARLAAANPGNAALLLIEDGAVTAERFHSIDEPVNRDTVFPVASLSKWLAAWGVMTLVQDGRLDLDRPVNDYLTRWRLPGGASDAQQVTTRLLLSHTAGLTDGLGFADYQPGEPLPSLVESLQSPRASSGEPVAIRVELPPGSEWRYSGGGYLVLELLIEELTGRTFAQHQQRAVFEPLGMTRSGYGSPATMGNAAESYTAAGDRAPLYRYASGAATGLVTSAGDLGRFLLAQLPAAASPARPLDQPIIDAMRQPHGYVLGQGIWGLGTILYAPADGDVVFGHDGGNEPAINATARLNPVTGDGIVMLVTGHTDLATSIGEAWVFWQTGTPGVFSQGGAVERVVPVLFGGALVLLIGAIVLALRRRAGARS